MWGNLGLRERKFQAMTSELNMHPDGHYCYKTISCGVIYHGYLFYGNHVGVLQCTVLNGQKALFTVTME